MSLPDVTVDIEDGALGIIPDSSSQIVLKVGVCSQGTENVIESFNTLQQIKDTFGTGPLVDALALSLVTAGGPVYGARIPGTAGVASAVTHTGTGGETMTVAGSPLDAYSVQVTITRSAANLAANAAAFTYSLDGGNTVSDEIAVPINGIYAISNTGLTITFADAGSGFVDGDVYSFTTSAPTYSSSDLQTTMTAMLADPRTWACVHVIGAAASVAASAALVATLDTIMSQAETAYRFTFAVLEVPDDTDANIIAAFANASSKRVMCCAGYCDVLSPITGQRNKRNAAWPITARIAQVPIEEHLGATRRGSLVGVSKLYRDENVTPGLDAQRFATLRTLIGMQGYYVTTGRMMAPSGSDFTYVHNRRVMDDACSVARAALLEYLNGSVMLDPTAGTILERDARAIEADVNAQLSAALVNPGHASSSEVLVDRTHDINADATMPVTVQVEPRGYMSTIALTIGFVNPALQP